MFGSLFGIDTVVGALRTGLDESVTAHKGIAARVAGAQASSAHDDFAATLAGRNTAKADEVDVEHEMVKLANNEIRYDAQTKFLAKVYANLHTAVKDHG
jgi:flagellar basal body rod protein FlgB